MNFQNIAQTVVSSLIALLLTLTVIGVIAYQVTNGKAVDISPILSDPFLLIVGYFYGQHAVTNGARQAGVAAAQVAVAATQAPEHVATSK